MGFTTDLLEGLAEYLAANGIGLWQPAAPYAPDDTAIVIGAQPAAPDRCVTLTAYPVTDMVGLADVTVGIQIRCRAGRDPAEVTDLDDEIFALLHGTDGHVWGGVDVVQIYRQSGAPMGRDGSDREERSSNYYADAMRPTASRPD